MKAQNDERQNHEAMFLSLFVITESATNKYFIVFHYTHSFCRQDCFPAQAQSRCCLELF